MMRITLYVNPNQMGQQKKNVYFKHGKHFYRTNVLVDRLSDLNTEAVRVKIRSAVDNVLQSGSSEKHRITNKGLTYSNVAVMRPDL